MRSRTLDSAGRGKLALAVLSLGLVFVAEVLAVFVVLSLRVPDKSLWASVIPEVFGAVAALLAVVALGGTAWASISRDDVAFTFRFGWWCVAVSVALAICDLAIYVHNATPLASDWPFRLGQCVLLCLAIGVFEEFVFRGLVLGGLLAAMGGTHKGVVRAVVMTSLLFGMAHVDLGTDFGDALSVVQATLKIVQTGLYSILLCVIVLRTRRLGGVSLFHGFDDFVIIAPGVALFNEPMGADYVVQGDKAVSTILYYLLVIALYLPFVVKALRELGRGQDVCRGPFMEREVAREQERQRMQEQTAQQELAAQQEQAQVWGEVPAAIDPVAAGGGPRADGPVSPSGGSVTCGSHANDGRPPAPHGL